MKLWKSLFLAFSISFFIMGLEIVGARLVAPYYGSSFITWTLLIAIVLVAMSSGALWGGFYVRPRSAIPALMIMTSLSSLLTAGMNLWKDDYFQYFSQTFEGVWGVGLGVGLYFLPVTFLAAACIPTCYEASKNEFTNIAHMAGVFQFVAAVGSVSGVLVVGLLLLPVIGHSYVLVLLSLILFLCSLLIKANKKHILVALGLSFLLGRSFNQDTYWVYDKDSMGNRVIVLDFRGKRSLWRGLGSDGEVHIESGRVTSYYIRQIAGLVKDLPWKLKNSLHLGAGVFLLPRLIEEQSRGDIDVVDIDGSLLKLAQSFFFYNKPKKTHFFVDEARRFVQRTEKKYDLIVLDVFQSNAIPPDHLITQEAFSQYKKRLTPRGLFILNFVGAFDGGVGTEHTQWLINTQQKVFSNLYVIAREPYKKTLDNYLVVSTNQEASFEDIIQNSKRRWAKSLVPSNALRFDEHQVYSDDFSPASFKGGEITQFLLSQKKQRE